MDEDELKALIEDVIEDMIESGELEAGGDPVEFSDEEEEYNEKLDDDYNKWLEKEEKREILEEEEREREEEYLANNDRFVNYWKYY
jgi:hypothetical protein